MICIRNAHARARPSTSSNMRIIFCALDRVSSVDLDDHAAGDFFSGTSVEDSCIVSGTRTVTSLVSDQDA